MSAPEQVHGRAVVASAVATDDLAAARQGLAAIEAQIDRTTSATPTGDLERLVIAKTIASKRVEQATHDLRIAEGNVRRAAEDVAAAPQRERDKLVAAGVTKIVALEATAKAARESLSKLEAEQAWVYSSEVVPMMPRWESCDFRSVPPPGHYRSVREILEKHAGLVAPDRTWAGSPFMAEMDRLHRVQEAEVMRQNAAAAPPPYAHVADFTAPLKLRLRHCLDCLGVGFAHVAGLVENVPVRTLYMLAGARFDLPGQLQPAVPTLAVPCGDLSGETLGQILFAIGDEGPAWRQANAVRHFDVATVRRSQGEWVPEPAPTAPEAA